MTFSTPFINTRYGSFTSDSTPNFTGTAEAGSTVELFADDRSLGTTTTDSEGNWSFTVPDSGALAEGSITITAVNIEDPIMK